MKSGSSLEVKSAFLSYCEEFISENREFLEEVGRL